MSEAARLMAARLAAVERGDKALGRELYHRLIDMGVSPEDINGGVTVVAAVETPPLTATVEVETTQATPAPEKAVFKRARRKE